MNHGSLFSGIGGFDLAAQWMGWNNAFSCEINEFCNRILNFYWPHATHYRDIRTTDFRQWRGRIDILTGGFPCQPYSVAGLRKGSEDERHLWPEYYRAIREIEPAWVVGENVRGLVNWNGGLVFDEVQVDLESAGYEVLPFVFPAAGVGAPHLRERVWIIAYSRRIALLRRQSQRSGNSVDQGENAGWPETSDFTQQLHQAGFVADTNVRGWQNDRLFNQKQQSPFHTHGSIPGWRDFPTQPPVRRRNDGLPAGLDGITVPGLRTKSITAYGNAVVPQVVYQIFKAIVAYEQQNEA